MRGKFIVFEGMDGSGKTAQAGRLVRHLAERGDPVVSVEEPGGTPMGTAVRRLLLDPRHRLEPLTELLFYEASRHELVTKRIRPALKQGATVVSQRFTVSSLAYQGYGRGVDLALIETLNERATGGLEPDVTFWLDVPPRVGLARLLRRSASGAQVGLDRMEGEGLELLERVHEGYRELAGRIPRMVRLDGTQSEEDIFREILRRLNLKGPAGTTL